LAFEIIDSNTLFGPWPSVRADLSLERLLQAVSGHGVSRAMTLSTLGLFHNYSDGNAETLHFCKDRPELLPVATVDPRGYFATADQISAYVSQGFRLFRFFPGFQGWPLDHSAFNDILDVLEPTSVPVMVSTPRVGDTSDLVHILGGRKHEIILEGTTYETLAEAISVTRKHPNISMEMHGLRVPGALNFLVGQVGPDRIVFGSGSTRRSMGGAINYIVQSDIPDEAKEKILGGNIKRLAGI
jgi:predicted TIM-barrel fold metal-dependent hydrolase